MLASQFKISDNKPTIFSSGCVNFKCMGSVESAAYSACIEMHWSLNLKDIFIKNKQQTCRDLFDALRMSARGFYSSTCF